MGQGGETTFWDHLHELRRILFRIVLVIVVIMVAAFAAKDVVFGIIFAPASDDFVLYRLFDHMAAALDMPGLAAEPFHVEFINTRLTAQLMIHISMSFYAGFLVAFPYVLYQIFRFVSPALHENERRYSGSTIFMATMFFFLGVALNYFLVFPLAFRFLSTHQVSPLVANMIDLSSYIDNFMMLSVLMGILAELPVVASLFARLGLITDAFMRRYRKHAAVGILVIAAVITPTVDVVTMVLVFLPIYLLYEVSIVLVRGITRKRMARAVAAERE